MGVERADCYKSNWLPKDLVAVFNSLNAIKVCIFLFDVQYILTRNVKPRLLFKMQEGKD